MKSFFDRTFGAAFLSVVLYLLAIPAVFCWGVNLWPLIFFVPAIWARLVRSEAFAESPFRYTKLYLCSLLFWLITTFWVCFPHPLTSLGWIALSVYLAFYLPIFIAVSRRLTRTYPLPTWIVCPIVWVCVEWFRNHVFGGMSLAALEHSLYKVPILIQTAALGGQYLVGAEIVFLGCCLERVAFPSRRNTAKPGFFSGRIAPFVVCVVVLLLLNFYGKFQLFGLFLSKRQPLRIAITQGNYPVMLNAPKEWWDKTFKQYCDLSDAAVKQAEDEQKPLDLIIWPETVFKSALVEFGDGFVPDEWKGKGLTPEEIREGLAKEVEAAEELPLELASRWNTSLLLGTTTYSLQPNREDRFNSAVLVDPHTQTVGPRYDKVHLVMFGEYVPLAEYLPDNFPLKTLCQTASRGTKPVAIPIPGTERCKLSNEPVLLSPNICFEGLIPHLIRGQIVELRRQGKEPDILVNLSNVGWFYFTSETDLQFAAQIFRAVENRKPYITAANGGFSAFIDAQGQIIWQGKRKEAVSHIAEFRINRYSSFYTDHGDLFAYGCLILTLGLCLKRRKLTIPNRSQISLDPRGENC